MINCLSINHSKKPFFYLYNESTLDSEVNINTKKNIGSFLFSLA